MQLASLKSEGVLEYMGIEGGISEELALLLDESAEDVAETLGFLKKYRLSETVGDNIVLNEVVEHTGSEGASTKRMRKLRDKLSGNEQTDNDETSHCDADVVFCDADVTQRREDIETEKDTESEKEKETDTETEKSESEKADKPPRTRFVKPSYDEVKQYCDERMNLIDPQYFIDFYDANGWTQGKNKPIKDWRAAVRTWENRDKNTRPPNIRFDNSYYDYDGDESL